MAKSKSSQHPKPTGLSRRQLPIVKLRGPWYRVFEPRLDALHFGRKCESRFDAPDRSFGVLYAAADIFGAVIEKTSGRRKNFPLASIDARRKLRLVDLSAEGLARIGADNRLCCGDDYAISQQWSKALHDHPQEPEGILYRSCSDPSRLCVAIFNRAERFVRLLRTREPEKTIARVLRHYRRS